MANGASGRPKAADLVNRCSASNAHGGRCGNPAMPETSICTLHLGRADPAKMIAVKDRLVALTDLALTRLESIIRDGTDEVAERALKTVVDRTIPKPGREHAVIFNLPGTAAAEDGREKSPAEVVRERLLAIGQAHEERQRREREERAWDSEIVDAEIVEES